jgi:hypothetical protein
MKTYLFLFAFLVSSLSLSAKKVMFQVDMTGVPVNVTGVHITGDFQVAAGFGGNNFDCNVMGMSPSSFDTNIYQLLVDVPAFQKYEFMFVNGDQCYEVEFVPSASRANYNFSDYRWIFIDSLNSDTTYLAPVRFSQNAPQNLTLIRFRVNMQNEASISPAGVHTAGDFQGWNTTINRLYSFANNVYEWIAYVDTGNYVFRYYNGNTPISSENVPTPCGVSGNRTVYVTQDTVMDIMCFSSCTLCWPNSTTTNNLNTTRISPNPGEGVFQLEAVMDGELHCYDLTGRCVYKQAVRSGLNSFQTPNGLQGVYTVRVVYNNQSSYSGKLIIR